MRSFDLFFVASFDGFCYDAGWTQNRNAESARSHITAMVGVSSQKRLVSVARVASTRHAGSFAVTTGVPSLQDAREGFMPISGCVPSMLTHFGVPTAASVRS